MKAGALGLRARSGWATAIVLSGTREAPEVIVRQHIVLADAKLHGSAQPYHAIENLALDEAERRLERYIESSGTLARAALERVLLESRKARCEVGAGCVLLGSGRPMPELEKILASHAVIHAAEGIFFRQVLRSACVTLGLAMGGLIEKGAWESCAAEVQARILEMGRRLGPPWRMDEKLSALAAWLTLWG